MMEIVVVVFALLWLVIALGIWETMHREQRHYHELAGQIAALPIPANPMHIADLHNHINSAERGIQQSLPEPSADLPVRQALHAFTVSHHRMQHTDVNGFRVSDTILCECTLCVDARTALG